QEPDLRRLGPEEERELGRRGDEHRAEVERELRARLLHLAADEEGGRREEGDRESDRFLAPSLEDGDARGTEEARRVRVEPRPGRERTGRDALEAGDAVGAGLLLEEVRDALPDERGRFETRRLNVGREDLAHF